MATEIEIKKNKVLSVIQQTFANYGIISPVPMMIVENLNEYQIAEYLNYEHNDPSDCILGHLNLHRTKEGFEFWSDYLQMLFQTCNPNRYNTCKPPYRGWWHAPCHQPHLYGPWRWWDGEAWSVGYDHKYKFLPNERLLMLTAEQSKDLYSWSFYWPKNARVQRINQDWHGFKEAAQ